MRLASFAHAGRVAAAVAVLELSLFAGPAPAYGATLPPGWRFAAASYGGAGTVTLGAIPSGTTAAIPITAISGRAVAVSPDGTTAYVASQNNGRVTPVD